MATLACAAVTGHMGHAVETMLLKKEKELRRCVLMQWGALIRAPLSVCIVGSTLPHCYAFLAWRHVSSSAAKGARAHHNTGVAPTRQAGAAPRVRPPGWQQQRGGTR